MESHLFVSKESIATYKDSEISYFIAPGIACGFPSPATDSLEVRLSITDFFTSNPTATFFGRAIGSSLEGIGIFENDILVIVYNGDTGPVKTDDSGPVITVINGPLFSTIIRV